MSGEGVEHLLGHSWVALGCGLECLMGAPGIEQERTSRRSEGSWWVLLQGTLVVAWGLLGMGARWISGRAAHGWLAGFAVRWYGLGGADGWLHLGWRLIHWGSLVSYVLDGGLWCTCLVVQVVEI